MAAPIVQWFDKDNLVTQSSADFGIVDAGGYSDPALEFLVWNNRGGGSNVSAMTNVFITTKSLTGDNTGPIASKSDAAVEVAFYNGSSWTDWVEIGGADTEQVISASGVVGTISGNSNLADKNTNKANYAHVRLRVHAMPTAQAGQVEWLTRISYQYI